MKVKFKRFSSRARVPQKATIDSACYDLFAAKYVILEPKATRSIETNLGFSFSKKYMENIYPRSSLSLQSIFLGGGVVGADYRGNFRIMLTSLSDRIKEIETGNRITQIPFVKKEETEFEELATFDETERGTKGFGSSGK